MMKIKSDMMFVTASEAVLDLSCSCIRSAGINQLQQSRNPKLGFCTSANFTDLHANSGHVLFFQPKLSAKEIYELVF